MVDTGLEPANAELEAPVDAGEVDSNPAETESADPAPAAAETGKPERDKLQERFDKLTREKYEGLSRAERAEYKAQELERELAEYRASKAKTSPVAPANEFPTLESVGWDEAKHAAAVAEWSAKQAREAAKAELAAEREAAQRQQFTKDWERRQADYIKTKPDYVEKVGSLPPSLMTNELSEVIMDSPIGPEVAYYLSENIEKLAAIARLPEKAQAREIGRIEAALEAKKAAIPPVSKAPPPIAKLEGADAPTAEKDPDQMTIEEWKKWRDKRDRLKNLRK